MRRARPTLTTLLLVVVTVLAACTASSTPATPGAAGTSVAPSESPESYGGESDGAGGEGESEGGAKSGQTEVLEQAERTDARTEAYQEALAAGNVRVAADPSHVAAPGWTGQLVMNSTANDWEPAIAADPKAPLVYALTTRYSPPRACGQGCPLPYITLYVSRDGGRHWGPSSHLCTCRGIHGQYDPIIEVVPKTGDVYAVWMNGYHVVFSKSTDHGRTWSAPVRTFGNVNWQDKPILATSGDGRLVYVAWNGPSNGDPWVAISRDGGATWTQKRMLSNDRYFFAFGGQVLPGGKVVFAEASLSYSAPNGGPAGKIRYHALRSTDQGRTWQNVVLDSRPVGEKCVSRGCTNDFYLGHAVVSTDADGSLVFLHDGATKKGGPQSIWVQRSTNGGGRWTAPVRMSTPGINSSFPAVVGRGHGHAQAWYMQADGGPDAWNVWFRSSHDAGVTWSAPVKISDAIDGAAYITPDGFREPYGDYGEAAITNTGQFIAIWGEGDSYYGPGGVWFNRRT